MVTKDKVLNTGFFRLARNESLKSDFHIRVGAVIVRKGTPISVGKNSPQKTHPELSKFSKLKTVHAEVDAVIGIERHLIKGACMYVYREKRSGELGIAKPCPMCTAILRNYGVKKVYYTTESGYSITKLGK